LWRGLDRLDPRASKGIHLKKIILAVAVAAVAIMAVAASVASAGGPPARYQATSLTITATQPYGQVGQFGNVWTHVFNVTFDNCATTGSFSGTGIQYDNVGAKSYTETVTGTLAGGKVTLNVSRNDGETWALTNAPLDGTTVSYATDPNPVVTWPLEFKVSATTPTASIFANHGAYVSSVGGGDDAAHSCIGMPIH
jgi:hypothetical protein